MNKKLETINPNDYKVLEFLKITDEYFMATIKFMINKKPEINMVINYQGKEFLITGIIVSSDSNLINNNIHIENTYECRLSIT